MRTGRFVVGLLLAMAFISFALLPGISAKAYAADEIKIGVIGPMKFVFGDHHWKGASLAADKINAAGGVKVKGKSYKIVLVKADDNDFLSTPDAISAMERLVTLDKVKYVVGGFRTEAVLAQQEVAADHKVIFLGSGSAHEEQCAKIAKDYNRYKYWFRVQPSPSRVQGMQYIITTLPVIKALNKIGIKKPRVAILADKAQWADPVVADAHKLFPQLGCEVVGAWRPSFSAATVTAELSAIKSTGAHIIFTLSAGSAGNVYSKQWGELKIPAAMSGVNNEAVRETHWQASNGHCDYLQFAIGLADIDITPKTRPFVAEFRKIAGEVPIYTGFGNHDAVYILKEAMERAQSLDPDAIVPELEKTNYVGVFGRIIFTPPGDKYPHDLVWGPDAYTPFTMQWRDGKQNVIWPDGKELPKALIDYGAPKGWDKLKFKGIKEYVLPPWVAEYWQGKK